MTGDAGSGGIYPATFDQQVKIIGGDLTNQDISPNRRVTGEIVFEPLGSGVRVTARDESHRVLWGFVSSKETLGQVHNLVAIYDTFRSMIAEELAKRGVIAPSSADPVKEAAAAIEQLEQTVAALKKSILVKKSSEATVERARAVALIATEADQQIALLSASLKGMKLRGDSEPTVSE